MASKQFSNTSTGDAPADPYKAANKDEADLDQKVSDFVNFATDTKFGMMTTRTADSGDLVSRAMAIAATVSPSTATEAEISIMLIST